MIYSIIFALPADASVTLVPKPADAPDICPGSDAYLGSAKAEAEWTLKNSCDQVREEIYARVAKEDNWIDAHNQGTYANRTANDGSDENLITLTRRTGRVMFPGKYENVAFTDKLNLKLEPLPHDNTQCKVVGCSQSQIDSFWDFSTNFCNMQVLVGGKNQTGDNEYRFVQHNLETVNSSIYDVTSPHRGEIDYSAFIPRVKPLEQVNPAECISYPDTPIEPCTREITGNCNCGPVYCNEKEHTCSTNEDGEQQCEGEPDYERLASKYPEWRAWLHPPCTSWFGC